MCQHFYYNFFNFLLINETNLIKANNQLQEAVSTTQPIVSDFLLIKGTRPFTHKKRYSTYTVSLHSNLRLYLDIFCRKEYSAFAKYS